MSLDAVALLRIPSFSPPEDADVRELDDGFLLFLGVPFESDPDAFLDAIEEVVGEALIGHEDERGIFVFPDAAEPEDATTYEQVISQVGDAGGFIGPDGEEDEGEAASPDAMLGQLFEALGAGSGADLVQALRSGDEDALKLAQIRMMGAVERAAAGHGVEATEATGADEADVAAEAGAGPVGKSRPGGSRST